MHVSGGATRDLVPVESKKTAPRTYEIELPSLGSGNYGLLPPALPQVPGVAAKSIRSDSLSRPASFERKIFKLAALIRAVIRLRHSGAASRVWLPRLVSPCSLRKTEPDRSS